MSWWARLRNTISNHHRVRELGTDSVEPQGSKARGEAGRRRTRADSDPDTPADR